MKQRGKANILHKKKNGVGKTHCRAYSEVTYTSAWMKFQNLNLWHISFQTLQKLDEDSQVQHAIKGCIACLDGYLLQIKFPSSSETGKVKAYFSGHCQTYGINVQAACNHKCRFVYAAHAAHVGAHDIAAFKKTQLSQMIQKLPLRRFATGDNA